MIEECDNIIGVRCTATGVFFYSYMHNDIEIFSVSSIVVPMPDIHMKGFGKELIHRSFDVGITLFPGVRRVVYDNEEQIYGYYEFREMGKFKLVCASQICEVFVYKWGWTVFSEDGELAVITRVNKNECLKYEENGFDKEVRFKVKINHKTGEELYPLIFSIPMMGF